MTCSDQSLQVTINEQTSETSSRQSVHMVNKPKSTANPSYSNSATPQIEIPSQMNTSQDPCSLYLQQVFTGRQKQEPQGNLMESQISQKMQQKREQNRCNVTVNILSSSGQLLKQSLRHI